MSEGTKTVDITNSQGHVTESTTTAVGTGDGIILDHWKAATGAGDIDSFGRPLTIRHFPSDTTQAWTIHRAYDCCGLVMETDRQGVATYQAYDVLRRQIKSNTLGVTTETVHRGLTTEIHRYPEAVTEGLSDFLLGVTADLTGRQTRNLSGTSTISESPNPADPTNGALVATTTETAYANGLATTTATAGRTYVDIKGIPTLTLGTGVQISISYPDGRTASTSGALQPAMYYTYSVNGTGLVTTSAYAGGFESTVTTTDLAGRTINVTKGTESTNYGYYSTTGVQGACGKLSSISDADTVRTLYDYNTKGERTTTALKLDNGTSIDYGTDQVTRTETLPAVRGTTSVLRTETNIWKDNAAVTTPTLVAYTERTPDGLDTWSWQLGVGESHTAATIGVFRTETTTSPDNTYSVTTYADGLPHTVERYASGGLSPLTTTTYGYESDLKRPTTVLDSRTGTATTAYISATCDAVKSVIDPGLRETIFTYDNQGRRTKVDAPDTTAGDNDTYTSYNPNGTVRSVSGAQYPVDYTYDYALRMKTMITHSSSTASATTAWNYSATTGRLLSKRYHSNPDGTPGTTGTGPDYTYTLAGRLATRKWARGIVTEYFYNCGLLATVYYSSAVGWAAYDVKRAAWQTMIDHPADYTLVQVSTAKSAMDAAYDARTDATMPPVNYNYNAFANDNNHIPGTIETVTRAGAVWTYTYDPTTLRPLSETQPVGGTAVTRILTRSTDSLGRPSGFSLGTGSQPYADHAVSYGYNDAGSLNAVTGAGKTFNYGYTYSQAAATDPRVGDTTTNANKQDFMPYTLTGPQHFATRTYEATRDALASIENIVGGTTVSKYTYSVNPLGQRGGVATAGSAFGGVNRGWTWSYDARGQVTAAQNTTVTNYNRAYTFDAIGNRLTSVGSSGTTYYNSGTNDNLYADPFLNQYFAIAAPGATPVAKPAYDADGNLLADAGVNAKPYGLKFGWDSENRITSVCKDDSASTPLATYAYDYLGRRIRRTTTADATITATDTAYLYDGWNVVAEYNLTDSGATVALLQAYTWGLDLSGSLQGAGGVGGLLCIHRGPSTATNGQITSTEWSDAFYPTFDGNGNISEYRDKNGGPVAHFEYDPFGRVVLSTGIPELFTYSFSTKPQDAETGMFYYGYRFYDPVTGRWPSRDPIEENGGVNLYEFVYNDPNDWIDYLGREPIIPSPDAGWKLDDDNRWDMGSEEFYNKYLNDKEKRIGNIKRQTVTEDKKIEYKRWYDFGCIGVTHSLLQSERLDISQCYLSEERAVDEAAKRTCSAGQKGSVFGIRYWDKDKAARKELDGGVHPGRYDVKEKAIDAGRPPEIIDGKTVTYTIFDFGYRQSNGSFIHANHATPGMIVKISPSKTEFAKKYEGFNTTVYCVRCCSCTR